MKIIYPNYLSRTLNFVVQALDGIPGKYYAQPKAKLIHGQHVVRDGQSNSESTFSHKLVAGIEDKFDRANWHIDKQYETEISKQIIFRNEEKRATYGPTFNLLWDTAPSEHEEFYGIPDIVIHAGQDDFQQQNQLFIAELKTTPALAQDQFDVDLFKTAVYHDDLLFSYSAFIIVNVPENDIRAMFRAYQSNGYYLSGRRGMYIITKNGYGNPTRVYRIN